MRVLTEQTSCAPRCFARATIASSMMSSGRPTYAVTPQELQITFSCQTGVHIERMVPNPGPSSFRDTDWWSNTLHTGAVARATGEKKFLCKVHSTKDDLLHCGHEKVVSPLRFTFSLSVSTRPRAGRVGAQRLRVAGVYPNEYSADAWSAPPRHTCGIRRTSGRL